MGTNKPSQDLPVERVQNSYKQLCLAAADLNTATDELGRAISVWDAALKKLNLGLSAWVELSSGENHPFWWDRSLGYTKLKDAWGIALRTRSGDHNEPAEDSEETWAYNEASRWMRIEGLARLPDLIDALLKQAQDTTKTIKGKMAQAYELAKAIEAGESYSSEPAGPAIAPAGRSERTPLGPPGFRLATGDDVTEALGQKPRGKR